MQGHKIKNTATLLAQKLRTLEVKMRIIISGTPVQNNLGEMHALFDFVQPASPVSTPCMRPFARPISEQFCRRYDMLIVVAMICLKALSRVLLFKQNDRPYRVYLGNLGGSKCTTLMLLQKVQISMHPSMLETFLLPGRPSYAPASNLSSFGGRRTSWVAKTGLHPS